MGDRDPADRAQSGQKVVLELRQCQLDNARIKLAYEGGNAGRPDDHPRIIGPVSDKFRRCRLPAPAKGGNQANWPRWTGCSLAHLAFGDGMWIRQFADAVAFSVPSSSAPISPEYLATSGARIAVRRRTRGLARSAVEVPQLLYVETRGHRRVQSPVVSNVTSSPRRRSNAER